MKRAVVFVLLAACAADKPPPQAPITNQAQPAPKPDPQPQADEATKAAREADEIVHQIARDLEALEKQLSDASDQLSNAQNDTDRANERARLVQLQRQQVDIIERVRAAKEAAEKARPKGDFDSTKCRDNPLAKGC